MMPQQHSHSRGQKAVMAHTKTSGPAHLTGKSSAKTVVTAGDQWPDTGQTTEEGEDAMAGCFSQFWYAYQSIEYDCGKRLTVTRHSTTCEKQIMMPSNSVLYCSERSISLRPLVVGLVRTTNISTIAAKERTLSSPCLKLFRRPCHLRQHLMGFASSTRRQGETSCLSVLPPLIAVAFCPRTQQKLSMMIMV